MTMELTLKSNLEPAEICRRNGWTAGTRIIGDEGYGPCIIEITAVGISSVLARCVDPHRSGEGLWELYCRDWKKVEGS